MNAKSRPLFVVVGLVLSLVGLFAAIGCSAPAPSPAPAMAAYQAAAPTSAPAPTMVMDLAPTAPPAAPSALESGEATSVAPPPPDQNAERKIIKSAQLAMTVQNIDLALNQITGIASDSGGYLLSTRTFFQGNLKAASISFAVPVDRFEDALRRTRGVAGKMDSDNASGQDVTDQYVDLQSQLTNLQATADRIRGFLSKAQTVDEALKINEQLSQVEQQIESVKGKMNYMQGRAAFSTITVDLHEFPPTPTATPLVSPTPTLTPLPTSTPVVWHPGDTLKEAASAQGTLLRVFTEILIWLVVVLLPYVLFFAAFVWLVRFVYSKMRTGPGGSSGTAGTPSKPGSP